MRTIQTEDAPAAIGTYSQAKTDGNLVFTAGQIPATPDGDVLDEGSIGEQTRQVMSNIKEVVNEASASLSDVLKVTIYLTDISDFDEVDEVYGDYVAGEPLARSVVEVRNLPKGVDVEIEVIATVD